MLFLKILFTLTVSVIGLILEGPHGIRQCQERARHLGGCTSVNFNPNLLQCKLNMDSSDQITILEPSVHWDVEERETDCQTCTKTKTCVGKLKKNCVPVGKRPLRVQKDMCVPRDCKKLTYGRTYSHIKKHDELKTWEEARHVCQVEGGTLVKLDSEKKNRMISRTFINKQVDFEFLWIGLHDRYDNNTWYWTDGTRIDRYSNWDVLEPSDLSFYDKLIPQNCAAIAFRKFASGKWYDISCQEERQFLCEWIGKRNN